MSTDWRGITDETKRKHRARWFVYAGGEKIPYQSTMRGAWGYDVECSCGWKTRTGGAIRPRVQEALDEHRSTAQWNKDHPDQIIREG